MTEVLKLIAADYGKSESDFINLAVEYYIQNNSIPISFKDEATFQMYIQTNLIKIDESLILKSSYFNFDRGIIDLLCTDEHELHYTVVEVKLDADFSAMGQMLFYLESIETHLKTFNVKGIIVCIRTSEKLIRAVRYYNKTKKRIDHIKIFEFNTNNRKFSEIKECVEF